MGIRAFFHKIKMGFVRAGESSIPYVNEVKRYGNSGEDEFTYRLCRELPSCKIKRNVAILTPDGNAEIDCLVLHHKKLFAIEIKRWKGYLTERDDGFLQEKTDRWTGETHTKLLKSPFKQLGRAIYLLRKQIPIKAWVNAVVFFEGDELESVSAFSDNVWFNRYQDLVDYISNDGKVSFGTSANDFFERCVPADYLYANAWGKSLHCIINRTTLRFKTPQGDISADNIDSIRISHHWSYDELHITMADGSIKTITLENAKIQVSDNGRISTYALCKLDYIELGRTLNR
ncbi:nERD domain protein [Candidatus Colimorpha enterica]|uniref:NERD domain protein n=1 Tax=Candidatus Colimorpha enterica TaxID=3083063 RepID=R6T9U9_9BACT|nr:nERD domain protein [Candidatus Colimorpha enterica]